MLDVKNLVGLTEEEAVLTIKNANMTSRIRNRDGQRVNGSTGQRFIGTADYLTNRVNLIIENNIVIKASVG